MDQNQKDSCQNVLCIIVILLPAIFIWIQDILNICQELFTKKANQSNVSQEKMTHYTTILDVMIEKEKNKKKIN